MTTPRRGTTRLRDVDREALARPPSREAIDALPLRGGGTAAFDLSGLSLVLEGLDDSLLAACRARFAAYLCDPAEAPAPLAVSVRRDAVENYVPPDPGREGYYRLRIVHEGGLIRLVAYSMAAWIDLRASRAGLAFGTGDFDPPERAIENFCRVAVAWMAASRGGFLIHGASLVRDGRGYVFFGRSASGKSTLAAMSTEGRVVSDDLTLVLPGAVGLAVAGSPFRGTYEGGGPVTGAYPLAAMFRLVQDAATFVAKPSRVTAMAELFANLPFVNEALNLYPDVTAGVERAAASVPILDLHFTRDPGFWGAVDAALAGS